MVLIQTNPLVKIYYRHVAYTYLQVLQLKVSTCCLVFPLLSSCLPLPRVCLLLKYHAYIGILYTLLMYLIEVVLNLSSCSVGLANMVNTNTCLASYTTLTPGRVDSFHTYQSAY